MPEKSSRSCGASATDHGEIRDFSGCPVHDQCRSHARRCATTDARVVQKSRNCEGPAVAVFFERVVDVFVVQVLLAEFIDKILTVWRLWRWGGFFRLEMLHFSRSGRLELSAIFRSPRWRRVLCHRELLHNELQRFVATHISTFFSPRRKQQQQGQAQQEKQRQRRAVGRGANDSTFRNSFDQVVPFTNTERDTNFLVQSRRATERLDHDNGRTDNLFTVFHKETSWCRVYAS